MSVPEAEENGLEAGKPFKITNAARELKKGIVASSLEEVVSKATEKLSLSQQPVIVVLETDGTEVDDEEYFATLEPHTDLMVLSGEQRWTQVAPTCRLTIDQTDGAGGELAGLVGKLRHNICHVSLLGGPELELLSDMDPDSVADITFPDKMFLEQLKEASGRYLVEKRQAQDAIELLKIYHNKEGEAASREEAN